MSGQQKRAVRDIIATLAERFPACFSLDRYRKPLKVGIHDEVLAALPDVPAKQVGLALTIYTSSTRYLFWIREGADRVGLGGEVTGQVTAEEAENAKKRLAQVTEAEKRQAQRTQQPIAKQAKPVSETRSPQAIRPNKPVAPRLGLKAERAHALAALRAAARARRATG
jgi:ProP effector